MLSLFNNKIWLYSQPIDFRKQMDGLAMLVSLELELDPISGQLFVFRNRSANKLKLLYWDGDGFWLMYKRLERGRFQIPERLGGTCELSRDQLSWLLSGLNFQSHRSRMAVKATRFF